MKGFGKFGKVAKTKKHGNSLATLPDDNQFKMPSFTGTTKKQHTHATIKSLEKQMKKQFFWTSTPDRATAISLIDQVISVRKKTKTKKKKRKKR